MSHKPVWKRAAIIPSSSLAHAFQQRPCIATPNLGLIHSCLVAVPIILVALHLRSLFEALSMFGVLEGFFANSAVILAPE